MSLSIIILAAGQGTRMRSKLPKVLHLLADKPILEHIVLAAKKLQPEQIFVVYGYQGEKVKARLSHLPVTWVEQKEQLGTGHATMQVLPSLNPKNKVLILVGDTPLISAQTLQEFVASIALENLGIITTKIANPFGLGRVLRDDQQKIIGIVEEKDTTENQRKILEINTGIFAVSASALARWLPQVKNQNSQGEYYLPDIIPLAIKEGVQVMGKEVASQEVQGINDRVQLANLERDLQMQKAQQLMLSGVTLRDPARLDIRGELFCAEDVTIDVNTVFEGKVQVGANSVIGPSCVIRDSVIGENVTIRSHCVIENAVIGNECVIGPFARLRPESELAKGAHIGNFVEIKKSLIGENSKVNHLSYIGDCVVGNDVNVGAGTITCNYDGANKHATIIGNEAHIGSGTMLVAPLNIGSRATIGAGSTVVSDVPADALTLTHRLDQRTVNGWQRPEKKKK